MNCTDIFGTFFHSKFYLPIVINKDRKEVFSLSMTIGILMFILIKWPTGFLIGRLNYSPYIKYDLNIIKYIICEISSCMCAFQYLSEKVLNTVSKHLLLVNVFVYL